MLFLRPEKIPQGLWNVEKQAVENFREKFRSQSLLKTFDVHTGPCGEKSVAGLREKGLFHISFH